MSHPTALIAEDEPLLARALQQELARLWPALKIVTTVDNGPDACDALLATAPDVAFLDIRMPGMTGIEVARAMAEDWPAGRPAPLVVFVTAFEEFAVAAFRAAAVDYVLKPVQPERLAETVARLEARLVDRSQQLQADPEAGIGALADQLRQLLGAGGAATGHWAPGPPAAGVPTPAAEPLRAVRAGIGDTVRLIPIDDVRYFQATDKYVNVVTADGEALIREPLRLLIPRLDPARFLQIHRSTVVNLDAVLTARRDENGKWMLTLRDRPERLTVSRLYTHHFRPM